MSESPFVDQVCQKLGDLADRQAMSIRCEGTPGTQNGEAVYFENGNFVIVASNERSEESVLVQCRVRLHPKAQLRSYSIGSLAAFLDGESKPHPLRDFERDADDLLRLEAECLSIETVNSESLYKWELDASRKFWQNRKGQPDSPPNDSPSGC
jgi:hypothetical protein